MIPHNLPMLGPDEQSATARVLASGWVAQGPEVDAFEQGLCRFLGLPEGHAVVVSSGSAALYLALWALGGQGRRVGLPVYACAALRNAVGLVGGTPVYLDCADGSPNLDVALADRAGLDILIAPSMYGLPVPVRQQRGYAVVEDVAQSLGAAVSGERIGIRGEVGICSFYATKLMTTGGQGGAVVSRDRTLIDAVRDYRQFDCRPDRELRFNFQMTDLQAAVGRVQLERLPDFILRREQLFSIYQRAGLDLLDDPQTEPVRYRAVLRTVVADKVIAALAEAGVRAIVPVERWELLDDAARYPVAAALTGQTVSLPLYPSLADADAVRIAAIVKAAIKEAA
ncbi:DegT/DnrJ/EryC1/StrS family aminotransferase [Andreprevotia chitinilytica]|uniref:DegT/DnrJ/EryC1/StrS family aminotransferase n=1 Tax=Andreprevotia chitinilytica TaxID=396808 RepID=UPI0005526896|nr:DegT/DnrJ/EryC1/StrS family aminotransferase [Andreprevotia chitinilytica]